LVRVYGFSWERLGGERGGGRLARKKRLTSGESGAKAPFSNDKKGGGHLWGLEE